ncbi:T9SS type A sorting domain-containing protein [Fluviicola sp.]|uniref:T9SS type A sorting domain-containing protein n=1 Tax=Fluviicola sp. TaxID=1917219 RepID=UPI003D2DE4A4
MNRLIFIITFSIIFSNLSFAQPGSNDFSFNSDDVGIDRGSLVNGNVYTTCVQADGKIIIGGNFTSVNGVNRTNIARLNKNGTLDSSFNLNYSLVGSSNNYSVRTSVIQPDGKILMGLTPNVGSGSTREIIRINPDGTLESVLNNTNGDIYSLNLQSDGKIILAGEFTQVSISNCNKIARLNSNGSIDQSFYSGNGTFGNIYSTVLQPDGKILVGGNFSSINYASLNKVARLNSDGTLDTSFNPGTGANSFVYAMNLQTDGKILIGGSFTNIDGFAINRIARLNNDGSRDNSFNPGTGINQNNVWNIQCQSDGKILVGGTFTSVNDSIHKGIVRFEQNGAIDTTFNPVPPTNIIIYSIHVLSGGKIVLGGSFTSINDTPFNRIVKLNTDGTLDDMFNSGTGATNSIYAISLQADSKIIVGGVFTSLNSTYQNGVARLNYDGTLDATFNAEAGANSNISSSQIQPDGKILVGGNFTSFHGTAINRIARLNTDGTLDSTFNPGSGANGAVTVIVIQSDGKILIGGEFYTVNNISMPKIARLNSDGSLDASFVINTGFNDYLTSIALQPNGKILATGNFTSFSGVSNKRIIRLNNDGTQDLTFNVGLGANTAVNAIAIQPDGKILAGGSFTTINGNTCKAIVRLNADGTMDQGFNLLTMSGSVNSISSLVLQSNGQIIIGGIFSTINGVSRKNIARLNSDGTLDVSFDPGTGANTAVTNLVIQTDGRILLSGNFTTYNGIKRNRIARLLDCYPVNQTSQVNNCGDYYWGQTGITYTNSGIYYDSLVSSGGCDSIIVLNLSILSDSVIDTQLACDSLTWIDGITYYSSTNIPIIVLQNAAGCDSIVTLNLTINHASSAVETQIVCDSFFWPANNQTYTNSGQYVDTIPSVTGCDSIITLNLTILNSSSSAQTEITCDSFTWSVNGQTYVFSGQYVDTIPNVVGCDSIITLDLTIHNSSFATETQNACGSFTWSINSQTYMSSGLYMYTIPNVAGCDSIITLDLTINDVTTGTDVQTACDSLIWIDGNIYTSSTNTPTFILQNAAGCDSIITLDLTIIPSLPLVIENIFSMPSDANNCVGEVTVTVSGNADFELDFDNGSQVITSSGYSLVTGLCAGVHDLHVTDNCGDTLSVPVVIPIDSNFVFNNPFIDSLAQDSLGVTMTNCDIYYAGIDTAYIDSIWATGNTVNVIWNIVDSNGSNFDTTSYVLNNGNGVYWIQLSVFCQNKSLGEYFTVTEAIYFNNGSVSTAGLADIGKNIFEIYPNPTNNEVHISFSGSEAELTVYDLQGKMVLKDQIQNNGIVSLQNFERGVYLFDFKNSRGHSVQRVVKQ